MNLYNTKTRKADPIDDQAALHQALLEGTHSFAAGEKVTVKSPEGELGTIPAENIQAAIQQGFLVETPSQRQIREYVEANKGLKGAVKVGLGQFADEAAMGLPELIYDKTADPLEVAKKEALKREHDLANTLGGITGFGASLAFGGPLWKSAAKAGEKVSAHVAEKLLVQAGEEVGKRTVSRAAKEIAAQIVAKGAGGAVEGIVGALPHAITEAALGDPGDAAETVLAGVGIGSLFGAGGVLAKELFNLGKAGVTKGASLVTGQEENAKSLARKAAKVLTGVNEDDILHYVQNSDRVNQVGQNVPREAIKDMIDEAVGQRLTAVDAAKEGYASAIRELDDAYKAARFDLSRAKPPESLADEIVGALESQKGVLGELSEQADEALEASGLTFKKKDLLKLLDDIGGSIGVETGKKGERVLISDEAVGAVSKLKAQRDRLASLGDEIGAADLRAILREVRKDIKWNQLAGEFNDTLNKARKTFQERVSGVLKDQVPEYSQIMTAMKERSETLEAMSKAFGSREKALGALNATVTAKGQVKDELLAKFSALTGQDFAGQLAEFKKAKSLLEASKRGDIKAELLPELTAKAKAAQEALAKAQEALEPIRRLTPERTQNIIRQQGFKHASIEDRRALEVLGGDVGQNFVELIKDRNVFDAFSKEMTNGSRRTLLGTVLGGMVGGGPVGAAVGGVVGASADIYAGQWLKKLLDAGGDKSGLIFSEKAMKKAAEKLDKVPEVLGTLGERARSTARPASIAALARLLSVDEPSEQATTRTERIKKLEEINEKAAILVSNPGLLSERVAQLTSPLSNGGAPEIGAMTTQKMTQALTYLHAVMPKPPRPRSPFAPKVVFKPTDAELSAFEQKAQVVMDPFSVLDELKAGSLTRHHMEALQAVYPGIYRMIQERVQKSVVEGVKPVPYAQRVKLSLLMGVPMDESLTPQSIAYYQEPYVAQEQAEAQAQQGSFKAQVNVAGQMQTHTDRIAARRG